MLKDLLIAGCGGFVGSALRMLVSLTVPPAWTPAAFPTGTLLVNIVGSAVIGFACGAVPPGGWRIFVMTGVCGGFTTFSAFSLETFRLLRHGATGTALGYVGASLVGCVAAAAAGWYVAAKTLE